jgi:hypothetical protein
MRRRWLADAASFSVARSRSVLVSDCGTSQSELGPSPWRSFARFAVKSFHCKERQERREVRNEVSNLKSGHYLESAMVAVRVLFAYTRADDPATAENIFFLVFPEKLTAHFAVNIAPASLPKFT